MAAYLSLRASAQVTIVTERNTTKWASTYGYDMAYIPDHVLQKLFTKKDQLFGEGYDEMTRRGLEFIIREIIIPYYAGVYQYLHEVGFCRRELRENRYASCQLRRCCTLSGHLSCCYEPYNGKAFMLRPAHLSRRCCADIS
jgi:hypothetical protein